MDVSKLVPDSFFEDSSVARRKKTQGKSLWTRFVGSLNNLFNPGHDWMDYDNAPVASASDPLGSLFNKFTGSGLTGQQVAQNELSMQNAEDIYQRQVSGMQKAGLNPALMYQNGASGNAPEAPNASDSGASMSDLMQLFLMPMQKRLLDAQIDNLSAAADQKRAETETEGLRQESLRLSNAYYPTVQEATLDEIISRIGVNWSHASREDSEAALNWSKKFLQDTENKYAEEYYAGRNRLQDAHTKQAEQSALESMASAAWLGFQQNFASERGYDVHAGGYVALAAMIQYTLGQAGSKLAGDSQAIADAILSAGEKLGITDQQIIGGLKTRMRRNRFKTVQQLEDEEKMRRMPRGKRLRRFLESLD